MSQEIDHWLVEFDSKIGPGVSKPRQEVSCDRSGSGPEFHHMLSFFKFSQIEESFRQGSRRGKNRRNFKRSPQCCFYEFNRVSSHPLPPCKPKLSSSDSFL